MKNDLSQTDQMLIDWISQQWTVAAPGSESEAESLVLRLLALRRRRTQRNDLLGVLAVAAAMLVFVSSTAASQTTSGWLDSTSFAEVSEPVLSADLMQLRRLFLASGEEP